MTAPTLFLSSHLAIQRRIDYIFAIVFLKFFEEELCAEPIICDQSI